MLSFKEEQVRSNIDYYIHHKSSALSRYEIDKYLLDEGYRPDWIEQGWQGQVKKQKSLARYKPTEKAVIIINFALIAWFFKPNIPLFFLSHQHESLNQFTIYPLVVLFTLGVIIWHISRQYTRYIGKRRYFLTLAPLLLILLLPVIDFFCYNSCELVNGATKTWQTEDAQYKSYLYNNVAVEFSNEVSYKCDNFGLLCFETKYQPTRIPFNPNLPNFAEFAGRSL